MNKKEKPINKYKQRSKYIKWLRRLCFLSLLIVLSPVYTHKKINVPDEVDKVVFLGSKELELVSKRKGTSTELSLEFAIDNDDQAILKELSNLKYKVDIKTSKGDYQGIQTYIQSVTDDYFVVKMENVPKDFYAMRVTIIPEKIDKNVDMDLPIDLIYYIHQDKITKKMQDEFYDQHAVDYKTKQLKLKQAESKKQIKTLKAGIKINEELVDKLKGQLSFKTDEDKVTTEDNINSYNIDIQTAKSQIKEQEEQITQLQEKINSITVDSIKK